MKKNTTVLAYHQRLPEEIREAVFRTLLCLRIYEDNSVEELWDEDILKELLEEHKGFQHWKLFEDKVKSIDGTPSRIWRGVLEQVGRTVLTQAERMDLFYFLAGITTDEEEWSWQLCKDNGRPYTKVNYIYLLKDCVSSYRENNEGKFPETYFDLTKRPTFKYGFLTYSADDGANNGQAIRYKLEGDALKIRIKLLDENWDWMWFETSITLSEKVMEKLTNGGKLVAPDLRRNHDKVFLDVKVKVPNAVSESENYLSVDWGIRKLLTMTIATPDGTQIERPLFFKWSPILGKLKRILHSIDELKSARTKYEEDSEHYRVLAREIARNWEKFSNLQKQLAHTAANTIIDLAFAYNVGHVYIEDLSDMKGMKLGKKLNRIINGTVRGQLFDKVEYKAKLNGIKLERPVKAWGTSQYCPEGSGKKGKRYTAPNGKEKKGSGWFKSETCSLDADVVGSKNVMRRAVFGFRLDHERRLPYKASPPGEPFGRGGRKAQELKRSLSGWHGNIKVTPFSLLCSVRDLE